MTRWWRVRSANAAGWGAWSARSNFIVKFPVVKALPTDLRLQAGLAGGVLRYSLPTPCQVTIRLVDWKGRNRVKLIDGPQAAGFHEIPLPARLANGTYRLVFQAGSVRPDRTVALVR